jgi:uncharacterized protein
VFIVIEDLKQDQLHVHHVFPTGEIKFSYDDATLSEPIAVDFVLSHNDLDLHVEGTIGTAVNFKCSRCAKEFSRPVAARFDLSYLPQPKWTNEGVEIELKYEDMEVEYYDGVSFDVNLMVLEQIELTMPMQFVCQEQCKGLCYKCGADLNEGKCNCPDEEKDSRFSVLLEFKKKTDK